MCLKSIDILQNEKKDLKHLHFKEPHIIHFQRQINMSMLHIVPLNPTHLQLHFQKNIFKNQ